MKIPGLETDQDIGTNCPVNILLVAWNTVFELLEIQIITKDYQG